MCKSDKVFMLGCWCLAFDAAFIRIHGRYLPILGRLPIFGNRVLTVLRYVCMHVTCEVLYKSISVVPLMQL